MKEKYNEYSDNITNYIVHENKYKGYIFRELIKENTMYDIVLSSNSAFSKSFRKDVSNILVELRQNNRLSISNDKLELKKPLTVLNRSDNLSNYSHRVCSYDRPEDISYANFLIIEGANMPISCLLHKHVLYAFILPI